ncbi:MAG: cyclic nucleotide-binding domain-containing protein, partial [Desulfobulbaceae bacterium]|nr:cyclic nucleotide-binding domain-containing protein [Desulfobulbaceae bacterium]
MTIRLKIARTEKELDDVFKLRYNVYVEERKKFAPAQTKDPRIVDRFDALPDVVNAIAYYNDTAIAAMRINRDSAIGLPAEEYFDFSEVRARLHEESLQKDGVDPVIVGGSMLAIHKEWRNRRNVIFALFRTASGVMKSWDATHVIGSISQETLSLYGRIGFEAIGEGCWDESVGDSLVPILASYDKVFDWTFGGISSTIGPFWSDNFCGRFERLLLSPGDVLFSQGDLAEEAYAIDEGWISISRTDISENEMVLANLSKGALFGELAILDDEPRSATATAITNVGLIVLGRDHMLDILKQHPEKMRQLLRHFSRRVRDLDDLAMVQAFAPQASRVAFALNQLWQEAVTDRKDPSVRIAKIGPAQIAKSAQVREPEVLLVLETEKLKGHLDYGQKIIRFFRSPQVGPFAGIERDMPMN